jgi:diguanylate cyclase (GGDEF)-like protein
MLLQGFFRLNYLRASCGSGVVILGLLYLTVKFNRNLEKQVSNFLYFRGKPHYKLLLKEAITDGLTDLYDHKYLMLKLEEEMERSRRYSRPLSILMIDIDHFKVYNDTFGHTAGDKVLVALAAAFKELSRKADTVARYGGEEFVVVLPETKKEGAVVLAHRIRSRAEGLKLEYNKGVTVSIGVGFFDGADKDFTAEEFIAAADEALYKAKANGRNRVEA